MPIMANKVKRIDLRVTEAELELVEALALSRGKTKSAFLLDLAKAAAELKLKEPPNDDDAQGKDSE